MRKILLMVSLISITFGFAEIYYNIGINLEGILSIYLGLGYKYDNNASFGVNMGVSFDKYNNIVLIPNLYIRKYFGNFLGNIGTKSIFVSKTKDFLLLLELGMGMNLYDIQSIINFDFTLPVSAVKSIKGPIPSLSLEAVKEF